MRLDVLHVEVGMHAELHVRVMVVVHHSVYDHGARVYPSKVSRRSRRAWGVDVI